MTSWCASESDFRPPTQAWHATYKYTSAFTPFVFYLTDCAFTIRYNSPRVSQRLPKQYNYNNPFHRNERLSRDQITMGLCLNETINNGL